MRIFKQTSIDFVMHYRTFVTISVIYITLAVIIFFLRGLNLGLDFTGGTLLQVKFEKPVTTANIRQALTTINQQDAVIQKSSNVDEFIIRAPMTFATDSAASVITQALQTIPGNSFETIRAEQVGPKIGKELRSSAVKAVLATLVVILVYISIRFKFEFALGAVIALIHDVLFTLGIFSIFKLEFSLSTIAAFLTIVGYSLNDTIVVFDRVRENMKTRRYNTMEELFNVSINETLNRTIITSLTTLFVVLVLVFVHGEVKVFSIALIVGIIVGTYSSLYIASPVVLIWHKRLASQKQ